MTVKGASRHRQDRSCTLCSAVFSGSRTKAMQSWGAVLQLPQLVLAVGKAGLCVSLLVALNSLVLCLQTEKPHCYDNGQMWPESSSMRSVIGRMRGFRMLRRPQAFFCSQSKNGLLYF